MQVAPAAGATLTAGAVAVRFGTSPWLVIRPPASRRVSAWSRPLSVAGPGELRTAVWAAADWMYTVHGVAEQIDEELVAIGQATPECASGPRRGAGAVRAAAGAALSVFEPAPATEMPTIAPTAITQIPTLTIRRMTDPVSARSCGTSSLNPDRRRSCSTNRRAAGTPAGCRRA